MFRLFEMTRLPTLIVLACSLQACGAAQHTLQPGAVAAVTGTVVRSHVPEEQVTVFWSHSYEGMSSPIGGGLLGWAVDAAIDSNREKAAQAQARPLQEQTRDLNFRAQYAGALQGTLSKIGWLKLQRLERLDSVESKLDEHDVQGHALLHVLTKQFISGRVLFLDSTLGFYTAGSPDSPTAEVQIRYQSDEIELTQDANTAASWAEDHGQKYRSSLANGIAESMKLTTMALEHMAGAHYRGSAEKLKVRMGGENNDPESTQTPVQMSGTVIEETDRRVTLEADWFDKRWFISLPKSAITSRAVTGTTPGASWQTPAALVPPAPQ